MCPEAEARVEINALLASEGWAVQDDKRMNLSAGPCVAVHEFPRQTGAAHYLPFLDRKAIGVIEDKPVGMMLSDIDGLLVTHLVEINADLST